MKRYNDVTLHADLSHSLNRHMEPSPQGEWVRYTDHLAEVERLQGFPDNHTRIPWRGKPAEECPDGPRYKAIGNSKAEPVISWVGRRLQAALAL